MKKTCLFLLLTVSIATHAQVGFELGLNMANLAITSGGDKVGTTFQPMFALGMFADLKLGEGRSGGSIYFEPCAFYQINGAKVTSTSPSGQYLINTGVFPLYIEYKSGQKCGSRFFAGVGPYIGDNLSGSYAYGGYSADLNMGTNFKGLDYGLSVNAGFIGRGHLYIRLRYQQGLTNEIPAPEGSAKNSIVQSYGELSIGYMIRGCHHFHHRHGHPGSGEGNHWRGMKKNVWSRHAIYHTPGPGM